MASASTPAYVEETSFFDFSDDHIQKLLASIELDNKTKMEQAITLYYKIRDGWRYNASTISLDPLHYKASQIAQRDNAHCIDKSTLLIACLRARGIPAKLELAKIKNHLAVERLIEMLGTDELVPHGFVSLYLEGKWVKASPAFNRELCERYNVHPLEFDGRTDSIFQEYNANGSLFMEYLEYYGAFTDVPLEFIFEKWKEHYAHLKDIIIAN